MNYRQNLKSKNRIVIKVGTSSLTHTETGQINLEKLERLVRIIINLRNKGKDVILVSSGAIGIGRKVLGVGTSKDIDQGLRQACAAVGQGRLMMLYEKLFSEYSQVTAQILLTKEAVSNEECAHNTRNAFAKLMSMNVVPIVNENDAIAVDMAIYGNFGDNDTLSAYVAELVGADLLILLSDIDGLYTDDPNVNPAARFIHTVTHFDEKLDAMAKEGTSDWGTGGMVTKIAAAKIATAAGADMVIANGDNVYNISEIVNGKRVGTLFVSAGASADSENDLAPERPQYRRPAKRQRIQSKKHLD